MALEDKSFFGPVDRVQRIVGDKVVSTIASEMPAHCYEGSVSTLVAEAGELEDRIEEKREGPSIQSVPKDSLNKAQIEVDGMKARISLIKASRPKFTNGELDQINKTSTELGDKIADAMTTRKDIKDGSYTALEILDRQTKPCIKIDPALAAACGLRMNSKGEVTMHDANRAYMMSRNILGERPNLERLRRDR
jgi:hypothetical protein